MSDSRPDKRAFEKALTAKLEARHRAAALPYEEKVRRMLQLAANMKLLRSSHPGQLQKSVKSEPSVWATLRGQGPGMAVSARPNATAPILRSASTQKIVFGSSASFLTAPHSKTAAIAERRSARPAISGSANRVDALIATRQMQAGSTLSVVR